MSWCASAAGEKRPSWSCPMIQNFTARRRRMCIMLAPLDTPPWVRWTLHWKRRHFITLRSNACQKAGHCTTTKWWIFWLSDQRWCAARSYIVRQSTTRRMLRCDGQSRLRTTCPMMSLGAGCSRSVTHLVRCFWNRVTRPRLRLCSARILALAVNLHVQPCIRITSGR